MYTDITSVLHESAYSLYRSNAEQHQQYVYTMHDAPLVDDDHTGNGRVYTGTPADLNTSSNNSKCCYTLDTRRF
jgi:hypothetical protein